MWLKQKRSMPRSITIRSVTLALVAALGVLVVFLHPMALGAYTVTHGPATDLCNIAALDAIFAAIGAEMMLSLLCLALWSSCPMLRTADKLRESAVLALRC